MTSTERAVRKASGERLLRDFRRAARIVAELQAGIGLCLADRDAADAVLFRARLQTSRTRYACLMTAFGQ